ncbi:apolipoprotein N-acyltransferase [Nonomuraea sp. 3-1Str]|uniref:apolipoprotein N-acyltransferase n=1 Tax=Nonomuraea sp. 3-1Str TaxID=2929801 RepID=UPI0028640AF5|nr:apolipoprotein N-acyltransferase [Nonomuraea sp. 3-1Str]MDR8409391.1 apolipoprotein N-acyltransferase [Nonomuraea sp. 3-1Str]
MQDRTGLPPTGGESARRRPSATVPAPEGPSRPPADGEGPPRLERAAEAAQSAVKAAEGTHVTAAEGAAVPAAEGAGAGGLKGREPARLVLLRAIAAVAGGALLFLAFPPLGWWPAAPLGVALVVASLYGARPRRAAWLGYLAAVVFLVPALAWVRTIGDDVWVMLVAVEGLFYAAMAALASPVFRLRLWPLWFAGLWVAMEWARGLVPIGGFPWARLAFSQGESLYTAYAALGGAPLVSFAVTLSGALLAHALLAFLPLARVPSLARLAGGDLARARLAGARERTRGVAGAARRLAPVLLAVAVPALTFAVPRPGDEGRTVNVGIVQGNVPGRGMYALGDEPAVVLKNHSAETERLAAAVNAGTLPRPDLVVLPENSTDIDPYRDTFARETIDASVKAVGVPTLVGAVVAIGDEHRATRSLVWDPVTGPGAYYDKQHLVPFGEYTPFKDIVLALWERASLVGRQSVAGTKPGDLKMGPVTIGAVNCYEVAYDDTVRGTVRTGASPIVVQTNNATYALSNLPPQQLAMSQIRAVEHNRAVVTAATTGISAYVTPDGKVSWRTRELVADMTVVKVPVRTQETIATRVGALPEWALALMGVAAAGVAVWRGRRQGDRTGRG